MLLLLAIVGCGAWWLRQYWLRLDQENSPWRAGFFSWILRGMAFPTLLWALANVGYGDRFPPLVPRLAEAQVARAPWIEQWVGVCFAGAVLIASYWTAVSYLWILGLMFRRTRHRAELPSIRR